MQVKVTGETEAKLIEAAQFYGKILLHPKTYKNIHLEINLVELDLLGECLSDDDKKSPRFFTINLNKDQCHCELYGVLAHEMVHLEQYATNKLQDHTLIFGVDGFRIVTKWMGEEWKPKKNEDPYYDSPWELSAFGKEVGLSHRWSKELEHLNNNC